MVEPASISIIITSYTLERLKDIIELLESIKEQTYSHIETIFVAENSRELSNQVKSYIEENDLLNMRVIFNDGEPGASAARNLGIKVASGDIIAFIDDDAIPSFDWAEEMVKSYSDEHIIGVTGPALALWQKDPVAWLPEEFYWIISCTNWCHSDKINAVRNVWLENASFRRESFDLAGYLDTKLGPRDSCGSFKQREFKEGIISEEVEFSLRVREKTGKQIIYNPQVKVWHKVREDRLQWRYIIRWSYWLGSSKQKMKRLYTGWDNNTDLMNQEHQLLRNIFLRLFPSILRGLFRKPIIYLRKLTVTIAILFFIALGYSLSYTQSFFTHRKPKAASLTYAK